MAIRFSLQAVLDYRQRLAEGLEIELGTLLRAENNARQELNRLISRQRGMLEEIKQILAGMLDIERLDQLHHGLLHMDRQIEQQRQVLAELKAKIQEKRAEVIQARQDKETLEILKEKEAQRLQEKQIRAENNERDNIYISQAYQKTHANMGRQGNDGN